MVDAVGCVIVKRNVCNSPGFTQESSQVRIHTGARGATAGQTRVGHSRTQERSVPARGELEAVVREGPTCTCSFWGCTVDGGCSECRLLKKGEGGGAFSPQVVLNVEYNARSHRVEHALAFHGDRVDLQCRGGGNK